MLNRKFCYLLKILLALYVIYFLPKSIVSCQRSNFEYCKVLKSICGYGTVTKKNESCIQWKQSVKYKSFPSEQLENTTICISNQYSAWCATDSDWNRCRPINCQNKTDLCQLNIKWNATPSSIRIHHPLNSKYLGILVLYYLKGGKCAIYSICNDCIDVNSVKTSHFSNCKEASPSEMSKGFIHVQHLEANAMYKFYLIPVIGHNIIGWMNELSLWTRPSAPSGIEIVNETSSAMTLTWITGHQSQRHYKLIVNNVMSYNFTTSANHHSVSGLRPCSNYCFSIVSINEIGEESTESLPRVCGNTTAQINTIKVLPHANNLLVSRIIRWQYNNTDQCLVKFTVKYWRENQTDQSKTEITMDKFVELNDLAENETYYVSARAESIGENGAFTDPQTFFIKPFNVAPVIKNFTVENDMNAIKVFLEIDSSNSIKTSSFIVHINDFREKCIKSIQFRPKFNIQLGFTDKQRKHLEDLQKCDKSSSESFLPSNKLSLTVLYILPRLWMRENITVECYAINPRGIHKLETLSNLIVYQFDIQTPIDKNFLILTFGFLAFLFLLVIAWIQRHQFNEIKLQKKFNEASAYFKKRYSIEYTNKIDSLSSSEIWMNLEVEPCETEEIVNSSDIISEYTKLCINSKAQEKTFNLTTEISTLPENIGKNRFQNILPFDQTRIILHGNLLETDYINANWIPFTSNHENIEYIVTQGPLESTVNDFWNMIWEYNSSIIVMLTKTYEGIQQKCEQYWPKNLQDRNEPVDYFDFTVVLIEETDKIYFKERKFKLINKILRKWRIITHLHYDSWNDFSIPNFEIFEIFIQRFREVTYASNCPPYVVHCSAGVGRTGTFVTIDRIIKKILNGYTTANIYEEVMELRRFRGLLVQQPKQYIFIHDFVKLFINKYKSRDFDEEIEANVYE